MPPRLARLLVALSAAVGARGLRGVTQRGGEAHAPRAAVIVSGMAERLLVTPVLANVVGANARVGLEVDVFFRVCAPKEVKAFGADRNESKWLKAEASDKYAMDPKVAQALGTPYNINNLLTKICQWAREFGAGHCHAEVEVDEKLILPQDSNHASTITFYNPVTTFTGQALLYRWRSIELLYKQALKFEQEKHFRYDQIIVARDDDYWLSPYLFESSDFAEEPSLIKTIACLESHGFNDKVIHMGRTAAEYLGNIYSHWVEMNESVVLGSRNAEEYLYRMTMAHGISNRPHGLPMSVAATTNRGLPCFRKQKFNLTTRGGYKKCYAEKDDEGPLTRLFGEFNCDDLKPDYFDQLAAENVSSFHGAIKAVAGPNRRPYILTVVESAETDLLQNMLRSLIAAGEESGVLVVGTERGVCKSAQEGYPNAVCIEFPARFKVGTTETSRGPVKYSETARLKHAVWTVALMSGLSEGILFADPDVVFLKKPVSVFQLFAVHKDVTLAGNNAAREGAAACEEVADRYGAPGPSLLSVGKGDRRFEADTGLFYARDTPGAGHLLLRSWMNLVQDGDLKHTQSWAITKAIDEVSGVSMGTVPCSIFVNGNVFWGHRHALSLDKVHAVRATWMNPSLQRSCMQRANLIVPGTVQPGEDWWKAPDDVATMGGTDGLFVVQCATDS